MFFKEEEGGPSLIKKSDLKSLYFSKLYFNFFLEKNKPVNSDYPKNEIPKESKEIIKIYLQLLLDFIIYEEEENINNIYWMIILPISLYSNNEKFFNFINNELRLKHNRKIIFGKDIVSKQYNLKNKDYLLVHLGGFNIEISLKNEIIKSFKNSTHQIIEKISKTI